MLRISRRHGEKVVIYDREVLDKPLIITSLYNQYDEGDEIVLEFDTNNRFVVVRQELLYRPTFNLRSFIERNNQ